MKVFISYSRDDEALTHLLGHILEDRGIECMYDRRLPAGHAFDKELQEMIRTADVVLLLLTESSAASKWVNQEIGFALALEKPISPLAMSRDIKPQGFAYPINAYPLFNWDDPRRTISRLIDHLRDRSMNTSRFMALGLSRAIEGRVGRTRFLVDRLEEVLDSSGDLATIRNQAAFSIFCLDDDPLYWQAADHPQEYKELLILEKQVLSKLLAQERIRLRLVLWPVPAYPPPYLNFRCETLLKWMVEMKDNDLVEYAAIRNQGPNRYIFNSDFCIEGIYTRRSGYRVSLVHYDVDRVAEKVDEFDRLTSLGSMNKDDAISMVEERSRVVIEAC